MKTTTFKISEIFLLISLPVSLLVACNGDIDKKDASNTPKVSVAPANEKMQTAELAAFEDRSLEVKSVSSNLRETQAEENTSLAASKQELEIVKIPTKRVLNFGANRFSLNGQQRKLIKQHAQFLRYNPNSILMISGYSDSQGPADLNYELSKKRAKSVYDEFRKLGVVANQLDVRAYGEAFALQTAKSGFDDRRVELDYVQRNVSTTAMLNQ